MRLHAVTLVSTVALFSLGCGSSSDDTPADSGAGGGGAGGGTATGGSSASAGKSGAGGVTGKGGAAGTGGSTGKGGTAGTGAAGSGGAAGASGTAGSGTAGSGAAGSGTAGSGTAGNAGASGSAGGGSVPPTTCAQPITASPVTTPDTTITQCDEATLAAALQKGGVIVFSCGGPKTIAITAELPIAKAKDTVLDGGGQITLDGGGATRLLRFDGGDYRKTKTTVTLQRLTLANAKAKGTKMFPPAPPPCSQGFFDGGGGAIWINDGILKVVDVTFTGNQAATPGPDVAGGAIYATGSLGVTVVKSRFTKNSGSNGGAIGSLNSDLTVVDTLFDGNSATGRGANSDDASKCNVIANGQHEVGSGGNGAAIVIDGGSDGPVTLCGDVFTSNVGNALGGALFRTPDGAKQSIVIDQCTFSGNKVLPAKDMYDASGGGALYLHNSAATITRTTFADNSADGCGAMQADGTDLDVTNTTFSKNVANTSPGGAICLFGNGAKVKNVTFVGNATAGDPGKGIGAHVFGPGTAFTVANTLFVDGVSKDGGVPNCLANITGTDDLQWPMSGNPCGAGASFQDPMLGTLADNGGPTKTAAPAASSPAKGKGKMCPATDQTGKPRPADGCTAGAVE